MSEEQNKGLSIEDIKGYLRIDGADEDNYIKLISNAARKFVMEQIGSCDESDERVQMILIAIITDMYEKRSLTTDKKENVQYVVNQMIMQLQSEARNNI